MWCVKDQMTWAKARKDMERDAKRMRREALPFTDEAGPQYAGVLVSYDRRLDVVSLIQGNFTRGYPYGRGRRR